MRGMTSNVEGEMVLMLGMMKMVMKMLLPMPSKSQWWFPTAGSSRSSLRRWKKGSDSTTTLENYGKNRASLFCQNEGMHSKTETRRCWMAKRALVAWPAWWAAPPLPISASWLLSCASTTLAASRDKIVTLQKAPSFLRSRRSLKTQNT
jgi:hypothetical protein